ncbi:hypothetical protein RUM44_012216 [Polyplax serrata]|uniref:Uncharacterized protein n=1 Tax=Polyplax serrata TaxID=468196 RepID=A0ABR1BEF4_POLSC
MGEKKKVLKLKKIRAGDGERGRRWRKGSKKALERMQQVLEAGKWKVRTVKPEKDFNKPDKTIINFL